MIRIIYEDNHLLVVEKPRNMLSQEDSTGDTDLLTHLKEDLKIRYKKPGEAYLGLVHRLDRPVGGVMVFAKTSKSASRLSEQIRTRSFGKTYLAVMHGIPDKPSGTLEHYLAKDESTNTVRVVTEASGIGKQAILEYETMGSIGANKTETSGSSTILSLLRVKLITGRSHQIRVQFAETGHPIYGDQKYGMHLNRLGWQLALWSTEIKLIHPTTKETMVFECSPPNEEPWNIFLNF
jgi:23S rRNA pseudouridine1911/1915/1917 synthase